MTQLLVKRSSLPPTAGHIHNIEYPRVLHRTLKIVLLNIVWCCRISDMREDVSIYYKDNFRVTFVVLSIIVSALAASILVNINSAKLHGDTIQPFNGSTCILPLSTPHASHVTDRVEFTLVYSFVHHITLQLLN